MKIVFHIFGVILLFAAILLGPDIWEAIRGPAPEPQQQIKTTPEQEQAIVDAMRKPAQPNMPPQPAPAPVASAKPVEGCPEAALSGSRASSSGEGIENAIGSKGGDRFMVGGQNIDDILVRGSFDGSGGNDSLIADGAGTAEFDGEHIISFEIFSFRNGKPNKLFIFARGLASADRGMALVEGDDQDTVILDPCLTWSQPVDDGPYKRYDARDGAGNYASVGVSQGVKVEIRQR